METNLHFLSYLAEFLRTMFQTNVVEETKTYILCSVTFFSQNHNVYEIMWRNIAEPGRPKLTIWRTSIACLILKATNSLSEYEALIDFPLQQWLCERA